MITADWHLGKTYNGKSLLPFQKRILEWVGEKAKAEKVDWCVIAGDVYDKRRPGRDEMDVLQTLLYELNQAGIHIVMVAGNHDGEVLTLYSALLDRHSRGQIHLLRVDPSQNDFPRKLFEVNGFSFYALPYMDRFTCVHLLQTKGITLDETHERNPLETYLEQWISTLSHPEKTVLITHFLPSSCVGNESGVDEVVGQMLPVNPDLLAPLKHVFSGHLHRQTKLDPNITFPGAPYHLNPSDRYKPSVTLVEIDHDLHISSPIEDTPSLFHTICITKPEDTEILNHLSSNQYVIIRISGDRIAETHKAVMEKIPEKVTVNIEFETGTKPVQNFSQSETVQNLDQYTPLSLIQTYVKEIHKGELKEEEIQIIEAILEGKLDDETS